MTIQLRRVRHALSRLTQNAEAAGPDSVVFFYFSGHAAEDGAKNYMLLNERAPNSFNPSDYGSRRAVLPVIGIPYSEVTASLATLKTKASFVVIDSHYDLDEPQLFEPGQVFATQGRPLLMAADSNNYSLALSSALLTPGLTVDGIFKRVQVRVAEVTNGRQIPFSSNTIGKDFILNETGDPAGVIPASGGGEAVLEEPLWILVKDSKDIQLLNAYLRRFPEGRHVAEAQKQIDETARLATIAAQQAHMRGEFEARAPGCARGRKWRLPGGGPPSQSRQRRAWHCRRAKGPRI